MKRIINEVNNIITKRTNLLNENQIYLSIIKVSNMFSNFIKKIINRKNEGTQSNIITTSQYSKEHVHLRQKSPYSIESTQSIFQIICNGDTKNTRILPKSIQQYLKVLDKLQKYYSLPTTMNNINNVTRKIQVLYALYHQHIISYIKPEAPINNYKVRSTYKYLTKSVKSNKYCDKPKEFYKKLYQTINYNRQHKY